MVKKELTAAPKSKHNTPPKPEHHSHPHPMPAYTSYKPINFRVSDKLAAQLDEAVKISGNVRADLMRDALAIGLDVLARHNYDLQGYAIRKLAEEETNPA